MNKENSYKIFVALYVIVVLLIGVWMAKDILFINPKAKSNVEVLNINALNISTKALSKRNYSVKVSEIETGSYTFGNSDPFR